MKINHLFRHILLLPKKESYNAQWLLLWWDETGMSMQEQAKADDYNYTFQLL